MSQGVSEQSNVVQVTNLPRTARFGPIPLGGAVLPVESLNIGPSYMA
jgi:hypothetical protein